MASIIFGATTSIEAAVGFIDGCYGLMALPTMLSTIYLSPVVMRMARDYFARMKKA